MRKIFLLGGYDLEMIEIKNILDKKDIKYIDKKLSWGAKLSEYKKELLEYQDSNETLVYGIELEEDIKTPNNYIQIDHHGKNDSKPSSLEQVADILNVELSKRQKLIAANDSRYIDGMKSLCATNDEINQIRKEDRLIQGVTKDDEELAKKSCEESFSNLIYSLTPHFSAVSDVVYYKHQNYVIYNDSKLVFYSFSKKYILDFLKKQNIDESDIYHGGGEFGFVGIKENILSKDEIKTILKEFEILENKEEIHSYHTFMLPFVFDKKDKKVILNKWQKKDFDIGYNQETYFHKFFKKSLFKDVEYYEIDEYKNKILTIKKSEEYNLILEQTNLRIFDTDIGILTINLKNTQYKDSKAVFEINDYGRRLYSEYLDYDKKVSGLVPEYVEFNDEKECFAFNAELKKPKLSKIIEQFLLIEKITPAVDDRMFTISYYKNILLSKELEKEYINSDFWYEYIFVDGNGKNVQSDTMQEKLLKESTYDRWQKYGTMYGMSRYSFVCLANSDFPLLHMKTVYYNIFSLLLMMRASLLKFSDEVSEIAKDLEKNETAQKVQELYEEYIKFTNNYYFREITAKDQGLELYEKSLEILKIQRDIKDLDDEITELFKYVELKQKKYLEKEAEETNNQLNLLTYLGGVLLPPSILTGLFGMNGLSDTIQNFEYKEWLVLGSGFVIPAYLWIKKKLNCKGDKSE